MTDPQKLWLASTVLTIFSINVALLKIRIDKDSEHRPIVMTVGLNLILAVVGILLCYGVTGYWGIFEIGGVSLIFTILLIAYSFIRDHKAVIAGENFVDTIHQIDLVFNHVLNHFQEGQPNDQIIEEVKKSFDFVLDNVWRILGLDNQRDDPHMSLLIARNDGGFVVIASKGTPLQRIQAIEKTFRYHPHPKGLAGVAAYKKETIIINDFDNAQDAWVDSWIPLELHQKKPGSIICMPIIQGVGDPNGKLLAVLSITSKRKKAFDEKVVPNALVRIGAKIESLLILLNICCCPGEPDNRNR